LLAARELGDPDALLQAADADQGGASLSDWRERPRLKLLNHHKPLIHTLHFEKRNATPACARLW